MKTYKERGMNTTTLTDYTARMFAGLLADCGAAGVKSSDIAAAATWSLRAGALTEAQARGHMQTLRGRLYAAGIPLDIAT